MGDEEVKNQLKLSQQLVMTPQLQLAIQLLATPSRELPAVIAPWVAEHAAALAPLAIGEPDPADEVAPPLALFDSSPFGGGADSDADIWVLDEPPRVRANGRAFPRYRVVGDNRDAVWLVRALRQRARTYLLVAQAALELRPELSGPAPTDVKPIGLRELATAVELHESTISRVAAGCRFRTLHGLYAFAAHKRKLVVTAA